MTSLQALGRTGADTRHDVLRKRAAALSQRPPAPASETRLDVLECRLAGEHYAIDLRKLRSVQRSAGLTRVPSASRQVAGVLNVRGELLAVLDLASTLGLAPTQITPDSLVLLVEIKHGSVGMLVDEVVGVRTLMLERLDAPLTDGTSTRGIADGSLVLLDLEQLLAEQMSSDFDESG